MARHSVGGISTVVGTTARGIASVYATASVGLTLRQVSVANTTTTAVYVALVRFTNATGQGAALTEADYDLAKPAICTGFAGHTADSAVGPALEYFELGAAEGSGVFWTFGDSGILVPVGTANGIGVICPSGTGQILTFTYVWDE